MLSSQGRDALLYAFRIVAFALLGALCGFASFVAFAWIALDVFDLADPRPTSLGWLRLLVLAIWPALPMLFIVTGAVIGILMARRDKIVGGSATTYPECGCDSHRRGFGGLL